MYIAYCIQSRTTVRDIWNWIGVTIKSNNVEEAPCLLRFGSLTIIFWGAGGKHTNSRADNEPSRNSKCPEKPPVELSRVSSGLLVASRGFSDLLGFFHGFSRLLWASRRFSGRLDDSISFLILKLKLPFVNPETAQTGLTFYFHHLEDEIIMMKLFPFLITHEHEHITLAEEILFNSFCWDVEWTGCTW